MQNNHNSNTFYDFYAGVGGFRIGFTMAGFIPIGFCENDKSNVKLYMAYYKTKGEH